MIYLTVPQLLFLHMRLIQETGGAHGIRDLGLLQAAAARPGATFGGEDLYPDAHTKAAALMHSIVESHPMIDGNKRLGISACGLFLLLNRWRLTATNDELERFTLHVAQGGVDVQEICDWLVVHCAPV